MTESLFTEAFEKGEYNASISCLLKIDSVANVVELTSTCFCKSPEGVDNFTVTHKSTISNPIDLAVIVTALSTKYAACIAYVFAAKVTEQIYLAYGEAKDNIQSQEKKLKKKLSLGKRLPIFGNKLRGRTPNLKASALGGFAGCTVAAYLLP